VLSFDLAAIREERNTGLIGRVLSAIFLVVSFALTPALAVTSVTYDHGVLTWQRLERRSLPPNTVTRFSPTLAPGRSKLVAHGQTGLVEIAVRYTQRDGGPVHRVVLWKTLVRKPKPRIVAEGIEPGTLAAFEARGLTQMVSVAHGAVAMLMVATAYTAGSAGGSGRTASGRRAGYGIVAVDPRIIPLGTRLYIPGYGWAIAGDTGGDIVGNRIDLGFDSLRGAMEFGRRDITVYRLK
jgi:3D (Asp-Asp-Asp) domain-containing protein